MREFFSRFRRSAKAEPPGGPAGKPEQGKYPLRPSMPDIRKRRPDFKCNGDGYSLALYSDLLPFSDLSPIRYNYAIAILVDPGRLIGFITLERSQSMKNAFCFFDEKGEHHNFGDMSDEQPSDDLVLIGFISGAGMVLRDKFGIDSDDRWEPMGPVDKRYNALIQPTGSS